MMRSAIAQARRTRRSFDRAPAWATRLRHSACLVPHLPSRRPCAPAASSPPSPLVLLAPSLALGASRRCPRSISARLPRARPTRRRASTSSRPTRRARCEWNAGLWTSYALPADHAARLDARTTSSFDVIEHQVTSDLTANIGLGRARRARPRSAVRDLPDAATSPTRRRRAVLGETPLPAQAIGDLGLVGKLTLVPPHRRRVRRLRARAARALHAADRRRRVVPRRGRVTSETRLLAEYRLVALLGPPRRGREAARRARSVRLRRAPCRRRHDPCETRFGHEIPFGLGVAVRPQAFGLDDARALDGLPRDARLPAGLARSRRSEHRRLLGCQLGLGARYAVRDVSLPRRRRDGAGRAASATRRSARSLSVGWAPRVHDVDDDGIEDDVDQCRELRRRPRRLPGRRRLPRGRQRRRRRARRERQVPRAEGGRGRLPGRRRLPRSRQRRRHDPRRRRTRARTRRACRAPIRRRTAARSAIPTATASRTTWTSAPTRPRTSDGFQDDDGCPDPDNDGDGIGDKEDACPT